MVAHLQRWATIIYKGMKMKSKIGANARIPITPRNDFKKHSKREQNTESKFLSISNFINFRKSIFSFFKKEIFISLYFLQFQLGFSLPCLGFQFFYPNFLNLNQRKNLIH